jgi:hypothetical protein
MSPFVPSIDVYGGNSESEMELATQLMASPERWLAL